MSSEFVTSFFPTSASFIKEHLPDVWDRVFPAETQTTCPKQVIEFRFGGDEALPLRIGWPTLLPLQYVGVLIGVMGCAVCLKGRPGFSGHPLPVWGRSFIFFAAMNAAAIMSHSLLERNERLEWRRNSYELASALDVTCTGACALSAILAVFRGELDVGVSGPAKRSINAAKVRGAAKKAPGTFALSTFQEFLFVLVLYAGLFLGGQPWVNEVIYVALTLLAIAIVGLYVATRRSRASPSMPRLATQQRMWALTLFAAGAFALSGLPLDASLCRIFGSYWTHAHQLFLGCDAIMFALVGYLVTELNAISTTAVAASPEAKFD